MTQNQGYNPTSLCDVILNGKMKLPLSHTRSLQLIAKLEGATDWFHLSKNRPDIEVLKARAKVLRTLVNERVGQGRGLSQSDATVIIEKVLQVEAPKSILNKALGYVLPQKATDIEWQIRDGGCVYHDPLACDIAALIGSAGSGKSLLVYTILEALHPVHPRITVIEYETGGFSILAKVFGATTHVIGKGPRCLNPIINEPDLFTEELTFLLIQSLTVDPDHLNPLKSTFTEQESKLVKEVLWNLLRHNSEQGKDTYLYHVRLAFSMVSGLEHFGKQLERWCVGGPYPWFDGPAQTTAPSQIFKFGTHSPLYQEQETMAILSGILSRAQKNPSNRELLILDETFKLSGNFSAPFLKFLTQFLLEAHTFGIRTFLLGQDINDLPGWIYTQELADKSELKIDKYVFRLSSEVDAKYVGNKTQIPPELINSLKSRHGRTFEFILKKHGKHTHPQVLKCSPTAMLYALFATGPKETSEIAAIQTELGCSERDIF